MIVVVISHASPCNPQYKLAFYWYYFQVHLCYGIRASILYYLKDIDKILCHGIPGLLCHQVQHQIYHIHQH